jgi:hypothetical protein
MRLDETRQRIAELQKQLDQNAIKQTLKTECQSVVPIPPAFGMAAKRTFSNLEGPKKDAQPVAVNCVAFNPNEAFND